MDNNSAAGGPGGSEFPLLTRSQVAADLGVNFATIRRWERTGKGPAYVIVGEGHNSIRYTREAVNAWAVQPENREMLDRVHRQGEALRSTRKARARTPSPPQDLETRIAGLRRQFNALRTRIEHTAALLASIESTAALLASIEPRGDK